MVQDYVALSHMEIQSARLLTFQTAWKMDKYGGAAVRADLGMIKAHVSKVVLAVLDRTIQVCGALGYSSDLPVESWYRSTRFGPIGDGPDELHKSVLARTLLKGYTPVEGWPTEHLPSRRPAAEAKWSELRELRRHPVNEEIAAVFFDFAGTLFSDRDLRDAHLASAAVRARRRAAWTHPTTAPPRRVPAGHGGGLPERRQPARLSASRPVRGGVPGDGRGPRRRVSTTPPRSEAVDRQYRATIDGAVLRAGLPGHRLERSAERRSTCRSCPTSTTNSSTPMLDRLGLDRRDRRRDELRARPARASPTRRSTRSPWPRPASNLGEVLFVGDSSATTSSGPLAGHANGVAGADARRGRSGDVRPDSVIHALGQVLELVGIESRR